MAKKIAIDCAHLIFLEANALLNYGSRDEFILLMCNHQKKFDFDVANRNITTSFASTSVLFVDPDQFFQMFPALFNCRVKIASVYLSKTFAKAAQILQLLAIITPKYHYEEILKSWHRNHSRLSSEQNVSFAPKDPFATVRIILVCDKNKKYDDAKMTKCVLQNSTFTSSPSIRIHFGIVPVEKVCELDRIFAETRKFILFLCKESFGLLSLIDHHLSTEQKNNILTDYMTWIFK
jgi:hypothetical protein